MEAVQHYVLRQKSPVKKYRYRHVNFEPYILKADVLDVQTPQKIQIFRRKIVSECKNYQFCNVLENKNCETALIKVLIVEKVLMV